MPSRNVVKHDIPQTFYHIYARGIGKQSIFRDENDFRYFINLFQRYLSKGQQSGPYGPYPHLFDELELLCFCLMDNHFHLLVYQENEGSMRKFMQSLMTSYSMYFNKKYKSSGPVFESRYKASAITMDSYLIHITRYIHLNPRYWQRYEFSSLKYYFSSKIPQWLRPGKIIELFNSKHDYMEFLKDYEDHKLMLDEIKHELAD